MKETWVSRDLPVLDTTVALLEDDPISMPEVVDIATRLGVDVVDVHRALTAMNGIYVDYRPGLDLGRGYVRTVAADARRAIGQWPSGESLIQQLTDGLAAAAEREVDPERKSRLRQAAGLLGGAARSIAIEVAGKAVERSMGLG
jgi:hypothetical protein